MNAIPDPAQPPTALALPALLSAVRACTLCSARLPAGPRPVLQAAATARILIAGQAPGRKVHATGVPFDDASGDRLRQWLGIDRTVFHDPAQVAILPMGFCYPGTSASGDLPPRPECAAQWRAPLLAALPAIRLTLVIGQYAQDWHLPAPGGSRLTDRVLAWRSQWPALLPLPHPSPRNNRWLKQNPWFDAEVLPALRHRVQQVLSQP